MKKSGLILFVFLFLSSQCFASDFGVITVGYGEWKPYVSKSLPHYGFSAHVVEKAFKKSGIDIEFKWYDTYWKRVYKDTNDGEINTSILWSKNKEREIEMYFSETVFAGIKYVFFHRKKDDFKWNNLSDLRGKIVGGNIGFNYGDKFNEAEKFGLFKVIRLKNSKLNFKALLLGRLDVFIAGEEIGYKVLKDNFKDKEIDLITHNDKAVDISTYHLILTRKLLENKEILHKFNSGLKELKESGEYDEMLIKARKGYYSLKN